MRGRFSLLYFSHTGTAAPCTIQTMGTFKMGNRAVITESKADNAPAIYLHWNGGRASVEAFLTAARQTGQYSGRTMAERMDKFATLLARHFFECEIGQTVYRMPYGQTDRDNWDNGVYVISDRGEIIGREFFEGTEEINAEKTESIRSDIVAKHAAEQAAAMVSAEPIGPTCHAVKITLQDGAVWRANVRAPGHASAHRKANLVAYRIADSHGRATLKSVEVIHGSRWPGFGFARVNNREHVSGTVYQWIDAAHVRKSFK
jgi:hypothetical protein